MENIIYIVLAILALILVIKFAGKIIKIIFSILFIGFIVYMLLGSNLIPELSEWAMSLFS